ncbi:MAG: alpha/beta fold hydrolase [Peptococcaceae bacterium]|nr:alpha/beta fold hydrolase [Peptococcaceae bacterium]
MKEDAYVIVHGFGGDLGEIEYLARAMRARGLDVYPVLLAGHGKTKAYLKKYSYRDWIESVKITVHSLRQEYRSIHFLGFSMGGLICLHFAALPETRSLTFINTPIYLWNLKVLLQDVVHGLRRRDFETLAYYRDSIKKTGRKSEIDFLKLLFHSKKLLTSVRKPCFIAQCREDETVYYKSAAYIQRKIGATASVKYYPGGCHQLFTRALAVRDAVCEDICRFLSR